MSYEIKFTDDLERRRVLGDLPAQIVDEIESCLKLLAEDPFAHSKEPCFPHPPVGKMLTVKSFFDNKLYFTSFFFHIDDDTNTIAVRRVTMNPRFVTGFSPKPHVGIKSKDEMVDVVEIQERLERA